MIQADVSIAQWFFVKKLEAMAVPDVNFCICLSHSCAVMKWEEKEPPSVPDWYPGLPAPLGQKAEGKVVHVSFPFSEQAWIG